MKIISTAIEYMSEYQAVLQREEYSYREARSYNDRQRRMDGSTGE